MQKKQMKRRSTDQIHELNVLLWVPDNEPKGIVQLIHGMVDHIERYSSFAEFLAEQGYLVVGHDQLGHGESVRDASERGWFGEKNGANFLVKDVAKLQSEFSKSYPELPYVMLGHSMGSLVLRCFLSSYPQRDIQGAIIMGTLYEPVIKMDAAILLAKAIGKIKGAKHRSKLLDQLVFGGFNRAFKQAETDKDWLTTDRSQVANYLEDEKTQFVFTTKAYEDLFRLTKVACQQSQMNLVPEYLPLLVISGEKDPVGKFGRGIQHVQKKWQKKTCDTVLIPSARHELLNECENERIYRQLLDWMSELETI